MTHTFAKKGLLGRAVLGLAFAGMLVSAFAGPVKAEDRGWRDHEVRAHRYWHGPQVVAAAPVVYAPPVVYSPPPPQPLGINLILPLHFN